MPRLVGVSLLEASLDAHREDLRFRSNTNEARPLRRGKLAGSDRTGDRRAVFANVDATVGAFTAQVDTGQDHGGIPRVEVFIARGNARVDDRNRHAGTTRQVPGTAHAHLVEDEGLLLDVAGRVHRARLF